MNKLDKKIHVIAPCLRGMGFSSLNNGIECIENLTEDIFFLLCKKNLSNDQVYVLGSDLGAVVGLLLSKLMP